MSFKTKIYTSSSFHEKFYFLDEFDQHLSYVYYTGLLEHVRYLSDNRIKFFISEGISDFDEEVCRISLWIDSFLIFQKFSKSSDFVFTCFPPEEPPTFTNLKVLEGDGFSINKEDIKTFFLMLNRFGFENIIEVILFEAISIF